MHFSKTFTQLIEGLPPELQENSIQYRQLKKIINQIVKELSSLGLNPNLLHRLLEAHDGHSLCTSGVSEDCGSSTSRSSDPDAHMDPEEDGAPNGDAALPVVRYEFGEGFSKIQPQLRISLESPGGLHTLLHDAGRPNHESGIDGSSLDTGTDEEEAESIEANHSASVPPGNSLLWTLQRAGLESRAVKDDSPPSESHEVIIPLISDGRFFELLSIALEHVSTHLKSVQNEFLAALTALSHTIAGSARPTSSSHSALGGNFHPLSPLKNHAGAVQVHASHLAKTDLYSWREIFQLYVEAEIFESVHELDRGERSVEESERRLQLFAQQVTQRGLAARGKFNLKESRPALENFLKLNLFILNIKKFQLANSEASRKILKKHAKRTALPFPLDASSGDTPSQLALLPQVRSISLPRTLVQAIGDILLPVIPHIDDYSCLICTSLAFKPIRLDCGHLFCVRCLVKMQKRGQADCPMCRAPSVVIADRSNVDWALMNFMRDWFPLEAKEKLKANEKEASDEQMRELGIDPHAPCTIM